MKAAISDRIINQKTQPVYIVLEAGPTHEGIESAKKLAEVAKGAGADAVKFQLLYADRLLADKTINFPYQYLKIEDQIEVFVPIEEPLYDILKRRELSKEEWVELSKYCNDLGITLFTTATYVDEVDFAIDQLELQSIKINSSDVNELGFIKYCASKNVNLQLDTGNADIWEIERAVIAAEEEGCDNIIIHHCPSGYPARVESIHLNMIPTLKSMFPKHGIAFSDHSPGWEMDIAAVALGADMVEKTITLDRTTKSCEHSFSLEPIDAKKFVESIREVEKAMGDSRRTIPKDLRKNRLKTRRSPYALKDVSEGSVIQEGDFELKRPGFGVTSDDFKFMIGKKLSKTVKAGSPLTKDVL
ncbi:MAG: N-acetylneuraminate synthase family protein [Bacteroidota bacterium]